MKTPFDIVQGRIVDYDEKRGEAIIRAPADIYAMLKREYKTCQVQFVDSRPLSDKQRRTCYKLIGEIADYTGQGKDSTKEWMKLKFLTEDFQQTADALFSLSNAPMSLVCAFQRFLVRFILEWDIPCSFPLLEFVDDIQDYVYSCLVNKKCCICGAHTQLHHVDRVGMGRNREEIIHEGMEAMPLCDKHHTEVHTIGQDSFNNKYHLDGGIVLDKTLCRIYRLKGNKNA